MSQKQTTSVSVTFVLSGLIFTTNLHAQEPAESAPGSTRLPPVVVTGTTPGEGSLQEDQPIGPNAQPEWTTRRRFATTRTYVIQPWQVEVEQWWTGKFPKHGESEHLFQSEIGLGLPYRFQLDLYENLELTPGRTFQRQGEQVEARWALADWGRIPLNPTLYGEWKFNDENTPDAYEVKLLLGQDLAPRWHWGLNLFYEQEVGGGRESQAGFSQALAYTLIDEKLSVGVEMNLERTSGPNLDGKPAVEFLLGPSVQWRLTARTHLDLVPLFGTTKDSPVVEAFIVFGFDIGPNGGRPGIYAPTSTQTR